MNDPTQRLLRHAVKIACLAVLPATLGCCMSLAAPLAYSDRVEKVARVLDDFHRAATRADGQRYFELFTEDAVFIGTDAGERWSVEQFRAFCEPYFGKGIGWAYVATERHVRLDKSGETAWFDERLQNRSYGEVRGSGVLRRIDGRWKIAQYVLSIPVPNDLSKELVKQIRAAADRGEPESLTHAVVTLGRTLTLRERVVQDLLTQDPDLRPVVMLLADGVDRSQVESLVDALARRGCDMFEIAAEPLSLMEADWNACLERIRSLRGERRFVLVGLGDGAGPALRYTASYGAAVRGLALGAFHSDAARGWLLAGPERIDAPCLVLGGGFRDDRPGGESRSSDHAFYLQLGGPRHWIDLPADPEEGQRLLELALAGWMERLP